MITRRKFVGLATTGACLLAGSALVARSQVRVFYRKIKGRLLTEPTAVPVELQTVAALPPEGERISVETALNSRCSSDSDGDPEVFHWGMYDSAARLSSQQIGRIANLGNRHFLGEGNSIAAENEVLTFSIDARTSGHERDICMIGSGMQQQAVCLACAALGAGLTFNAQGQDGTLVSAERFVAVKMKLAAMRPSYTGYFWSESAPERERPWLTGNLPDPKRNGQTPLVTALANLRPEGEGGTAATLNNLSQLLWAARGRTPHLYKSNPWGLTIPTWQGLQDITTIHVASGSHVYRYTNWKNARPTHSLELLENNPALVKALRERFSPCDLFVVIRSNEPYARALWEAGYQILNLTLQASVAGVAYRTVVLNDQDRTMFATQSGKPVALVALQAPQLTLNFA